MSARQSIYFAHANGFPSPCYRRFFTTLEANYRLECLEMGGHNPAFPVDNNWDALCDELIDDLERKANEPVIGLGHSMGGILTLLASIRRPDLFQAFIMLDPPIIMGPSAWLTGLAKRGGLMDRITPAAISERRRTEWPDLETAIDSLKKKRLFRNFEPACLADYLRYGTAPSKKGIRLRFSPRTEAAIFRTIPHNLPNLPRTRVPGALIYGEQSHVIRFRDLQRLTKHQGLLLHSSPGGHMFPFEHPQSTGQAVIKALDALQSHYALAQ
ncbi:hypothetical protein CAI21_16855 [Alkalilimnicola ehrlichii]|uniref:AB hydrolase-1 domain-containing protein n=1 Tax=Alkalilimnicola ehrlichii TaxID=351052 RepID=A0A3E0WN70_9GAMM|nr:alpha/beta hydrolase [Alkalilimnicola ehrlichii]RFA26362.1 hypothetical protein CAI21_16855 [Alkalilimnicola ehrlichii]RFA33426.1 hypothetical protein CAL65_17340 [Alkalilimnicola ehrlichii]